MVGRLVAGAGEDPRVLRAVLSSHRGAGSLSALQAAAGNRATTALLGGGSARRDIRTSRGSAAPVRVRHVQAASSSRTNVQRWEAEGLAKANEIRLAKSLDPYARWPQVWAAMQRAGRAGSDLSVQEKDEIDDEYRTIPPQLDPSWVTRGRKDGLSRKLVMNIDGRGPDFSDASAALSDAMLQQLALFDRIEDVKILAVVNSLASKNEDTPEARYWNSKLNPFKAGIRQHYIGSAQPEKQGALGFMFSRGRVTDPDQKVFPWIEPGTYAQPRQKDLKYREVDRSQMLPGDAEKTLVRDQVHNFEMYRFTKKAPEPIRDLALITWYRRGATKKPVDFAKQDRFVSEGDRQEGFAKPADLRPYFALMMVGKVGVETKDLSAMPLWDEDTGPQVSDIRQGVSGNCWALAALSSMVATSPDLIKDMITAIRKGSVTVRFFDDTTGRPEYVTVTRSVTNAKILGVGYRIVNRGTITWPILILKAYASWLGSNRSGTPGDKTIGGHTLQAFDGGESGEALRHFTGVKVKEETADADESVRDSVIRHLRQKDLVAVGSASSADRVQSKTAKSAILFSNVQKSHAYSVVSADQQGIRLRNPWHKKRVLSLSSAAEFSISWKDFSKKFVKIYIGEMARVALARQPPDVDDT